MDYDCVEVRHFEFLWIWEEYYRASGNRGTQLHFLTIENEKSQNFHRVHHIALREMSPLNPTLVCDTECENIACVISITVPFLTAELKSSRMFIINNEIFII